MAVVSQLHSLFPHSVLCVFIKVSSWCSCFSQGALNPELVQACNMNSVFYTRTATLLIQTLEQECEQGDIEYGSEGAHSLKNHRGPEGGIATALTK